ncbi:MULTISPECIES: TIGR04219 family outer membrane beta-barrel protein [unclassified Thalassotalea]|uniref:TIGR04219 family outer membrane beta-barrel protein n=1 Tax=unclassified Thalassotalea TaxID=2614972 RepID=UPI0010815461|nr:MULTISPECIES: TIGR04219 family outer membrane beta-barrel protein [unclassified Thalassotalea]NMP17247.1 TIGR04219 family outer membrane beta-barrel protein [Thalassotalea sp. Y01]QBY03827.1 TIGR04219 family outer membrane beta-barrel protein [Thalassotalea sp. HSM 43]
MKKSAALISSLMMLTSPNANADAIGVYIGAQVWDMAAEGSYDDSKVQQEFNFDDDTQNRFYIEFEHPLPFIPNIKIAHSELMTTGVEINPAADSLQGSSELDLSYTDYTLYYELFDNGLFSFDFGLTGKDFEGEFITLDRSGLDVDNVDEIIPMLYLSAEVELPLTGLGVFAEGNILALDDHTAADYQAGISYALIDNMIVDVDIQLGYRWAQVELEDLEGIYSDLDFDGAFAGVEVHF